MGSVQLKETKTGLGRSLFVIVFVLMMAKLTLFRFFVFKDISWDRIAVDAIAVLVVLCLWELLFSGRWKGTAYWSLNTLFSVILFAATIYNVQFGSIPTYTTLLSLNQVPQVASSIGLLIEPEHFLFFADVMVMSIWWIVYRVQGKRSVYSRQLSRIGILSVAVIGLVMSGMTIAKDGSIENETVRADELGFLNYQVAQAILANQQNKMIAAGDIEETVKEINEHQATYPYQQQPEEDGVETMPVGFGAAKGKNLIIVQLESFQNFPVRQQVEGQEVTPVLNDLIEESMYFPHVFQQIGQGNTSDAEFMTNTSIYPIGTMAMATGFGDRVLPSLPRLVQNEGYTAQTFHVNSVSFWDRNKMYPALHFDQYFDKPYFTNDHFNDFGASDEEMYRVGLEKLVDLDAQNKPFYAHFIATSSHAPFKVPQDRMQMEVPAQLAGTALGDYLTSLNYADYALGTLIDGLKEEGLWEDTILVVYGDHFGLQNQSTSPEQVEAALGVPYHEQISRFNVPLVIHVPGMEGRQIDTVGGQMDILPTVSNLLGISLKESKFTALGQDLLNIDQNVIGMRYYMPTGTFFNNEVMFVPGSGFEDGQAISLTTLEPVADIEKYRTDYDYIMKLMKLSDEYVKLLPKRGF
ncbi:Phosphoglycerol transferase MdoB [Paenibacillus sp. 453mf]|nr:Phosphoglycerol transferase MdoB [Paenibacillus sp. 453mf]